MQPEAVAVRPGEEWGAEVISRNVAALGPNIHPHRPAAWTHTQASDCGETSALTSRRLFTVLMLSSRPVRAAGRTGRAEGRRG